MLGILRYPPGEIHGRNIHSNAGAYDARSSFSFASMNSTSFGLVPGPPAKWPHRGNGDKFGVRHLHNLELAILRRKIQIGLARHDIGPGLDRAERHLEVAVVELVVAYVAVLPGPEHGQQIVWILWQEEPFPERHQKIFKRGVAQYFDVQFLAIERLRKAPAGIDPCRRAQAPLRLLGVPAFLPCRIGGKRGLDTLQENEVMTRAFRRTAEWRDQVHHAGIERAPVESLQRAHRPAGHEPDMLDAKLLGDETVLHAHVV